MNEPGDSYDFLRKSNHIRMGNISITTTCQMPERAAEFLNWFYTYEGYLLTNYGEEGVAFEFNQDGEPV